MKLNYLFLITLFFVSCNPTNKEEETTEQNENTGLMISQKVFGATEDGQAMLFTLENKNGMTLSVTNYGGIITSLNVPDKNGAIADVVLGHDSLASYIEGHPYFGALVGRYGNRIAKGEFSIDGTTYTLATNNGPNALHGGIKGFDKKLWNTQIIENSDAVGVEFSGVSVDMEEGFPGNLTVKVRYLLNNDNELRLEYEATTDKTTIVNLTNHSYFNLKRAGDGDILGHELMIAADKFTPVDATLIPTGELRSVENTPFDFREPTTIGARVDDVENEQIKFGGGYDHNFVFTDQSDQLKLVATAYEPTSGRFMEVLTTEPGVQFYCGNFLNGKNIGKGGIPYEKRNGFCLETQHFPDSQNQPDFPSTLLKPDEKYETQTVYRFSVK